MNRIQEKAFQIFQKFVQICDELKLPYFMVCGSALGAVKYGGFIPWDDDIDVALFRKDYERFCQEAPKLLPSKFFLQNYHTDSAFPAIYSKLRDSSTTCMETSVALLPINHGICIDIFPLDGYPSEIDQQCRLEWKKKLYVHLLSIPCVRPQQWKENMIRPLRVLGIGKDSARIAEAYTKCISMWPVHTSKVVANHGNWQGKLDYHDMEVYGDGTQINFEGLSVRVPTNWDEYLKQKYGDYHQDPPRKNQTSHHQYLYLDPDHPYTDYSKRSKIKLKI